jgi:alkanesulfonate monooxygenase SsuD/methylene tetrahydromethanopterin reductase-like flavin-dependent oxidoreductase (luciferase family)
VLLAKSVATLAAFSGGRLDLGVGSGWQRAEYDALGVPIEEKVQRLEDGLAACRALWSTAPAAFASATVAFEGLSCFPQPPAGAVPIWFAGRPVPATLRRVAAGGAGWLPIRQLTPEEARTARRDLDAACAEAGREPGAVGIRCPMAVARRTDGTVDVRRLGEEIAALHDAGVDGVHLPLGRLAASVDEWDAAVAALRDLTARTAGQHA